MQVLAAERASKVSIDALAINAAAALVGDVVAAARVAVMDDGTVVPFPGDVERQRSVLSVLVAVNENGRVLSLSVESTRGAVAEKEVMDAVNEAVKAAMPLIDMQKQFRQSLLELREREGISSYPRRMPVPCNAEEPVEATVSDERLQEVHDTAYAMYEQAFVQCAQFPGKAHRAAVITDVQQAIINLFPDVPMNMTLAEAQKASKQAYRLRVLRHGVRMDGRGVDEIRPIRVETAVLGGDVHGSSVFERGDTQVLACSTIGLRNRSIRTEEYIDGGENKPFFVHYSFPPYATGESGRFGGYLSRREIGHSMLTERALAPMLDLGNDYPYSLRLSAEVLGSDGSSSMASVCAASQALMDAGAPIREPVAGVAMGLITADGVEQKNRSEGDREEVILTDILGAEDHFGEMDMKVTGTETGVTTCQMDTKRKSGLSLDTISDVFGKAYEARGGILDIMQTQGLKERRLDTPVHAPRVRRVNVNPVVAIQTMMKDRAAGLREIQAIAGADLYFDGKQSTITVEAPNKQSLEMAEELIGNAVGELEVGTKFSARVSDVKKTYAVVDLASGCSGIVHVSKMQVTPTSFDESDRAESRYPDARQLLEKEEHVEVVVLESERTRNVLRFGLVTTPKKGTKEAMNEQIDSILKAAGVAQD